MPSSPKFRTNSRVRIATAGFSSFTRGLTSTTSALPFRSKRKSGTWDRMRSPSCHEIAIGWKSMAVTSGSASNRISASRSSVDSYWTVSTLFVLGNKPTKLE